MSASSRSRVRRLSFLMPVAALAAVLSGCGLSQTNSGGWISGSGQVQRVAVDDRGTPVVLSGTTLQGQSFDLASTRGKVTVINVWGAWCGDCVQEATYLEQAHAQLGAAVPFLGIDVRDTNQAQAISFEQGHQITYPSIFDPKGTAVLAFSANLSPQTIPATLILDAQGRVATIIRGELTATSTLVGAVQDVADGHANAGGTV